MSDNKRPYNPFGFKSKVTADDLERAYNYGMIRKEELIDGQWYYGQSRPGQFAQWSKEDDCFYVTTSSMGATYGEACNHPSDDNGFALFVPLTKIQKIEDEHLSKPSRRFQK